MPEWIIHDKWALQVDISSEVSKFVNLLVDFPQKCKEYLEYCESKESAHAYRRGKPTKINAGHLSLHDIGRHNKALGNVQLEFLESKGESYVRAYYLHHLLDYIATWARSIDVELGRVTPVSEILSKKKVKQGIAPDGSVRPVGDIEWMSVKELVLRNGNEIYRDCSID